MKVFVYSVNGINLGASEALRTACEAVGIGYSHASRFLVRHNSFISMKNGECRRIDKFECEPMQSRGKSIDKIVP